MSSRVRKAVVYLFEVTRIEENRRETTTTGRNVSFGPVVGSFEPDDQKGRSSTSEAEEDADSSVLNVSRGGKLSVVIG